MEEKQLPEYDYEIRNGERVMTKESSRERQLNYLGCLWPTELANTPKKQRMLTEVLYKNINVEEPTIIIWNELNPKAVFASIAVLINRKYERYYSWTLSEVSHSTQAHLSGEFHDVSQEYEMYHILFMTMNMTEVKNYLNAHMVKNIVNARKMNNQKTFFFFHGTAAELHSKKWQIDEFGDETTYTPLTKYVKVIDLNILLSSGGGK